jgi:hypothetical protein
LKGKTDKKVTFTLQTHYSVDQPTELSKEDLNTIRSFDYDPDNGDGSALKSTELVKLTETYQEI